MDKTRGFYPLDLGSSPGGDTKAQLKTLLLKK